MIEPTLSRLVSNAELSTFDHPKVGLLFRPLGLPTGYKSPYPPDGDKVQRLFTTFANGWPGFGLFIQRLVTGIVLLLHGVEALSQIPASGPILPRIIGAMLGLFILAGLWTPLAGSLIVIVEVWTALTGAGDESSLILATLAGTLAMIGPGAWSIDARLFGRKHISR